MNTSQKNAGRPAAKFDRACAELTRMAYRLGPEARMPTFADLCAQARVSKATLDAVLGQLEAQGIVLRRQGSGIFVSPRLRRGIALVCDPRFSLEPDLRGFWDLLVREAQRRVAGTQYDLAFHFSTLEGGPETDGPCLHPGLMEDVRAGRVQGVLTVGLPAPTVEWVDRQGAAAVAFAGGGPVSVNLDGADVVGMGVEALAARGCRRLALWSPAPGDAGGEDAAEARSFRGALAAHGLEFHERLLRPRAQDAAGDSGFDQVRGWVSEAFGAAPAARPDGLLLTNDILARDVLSLLLKLGVVPDRDVVIVSHANSGSPVLRAYEEEVTLLEYDSGEIVQAMFDRMEARMRDEPLAQRHVIIKPRVRVPHRHPPVS